MTDPKTSELTAAVARLRRLKAGEPMLSVYEWGNPNARYLADRSICADAHLATVAADEGKVARLEKQVAELRHNLQRYHDYVRQHWSHMMFPSFLAEMVEESVVDEHPSEQETQS